MNFFLAALLMTGVSARAAQEPGTSAFAVALGGAAYAIAADPLSVSGRVVVRRLGLDGGVLWEERWGSGRGESAVQAAVTVSGTLIIVGDSDQGCFIARWSREGRLLWSEDLRLGTECHVRSLSVDADNNSYVLATTTENGAYAATIWKLDRRGQVEWSYRDDSGAPDYAFALLLSATADLETVTTVRRDGTAWRYAKFALDPRGSPAAVEHY